MIASPNASRPLRHPPSTDRRHAAAVMSAGRFAMAAHKYAIGQTVRFSPDRFDRHQVSSTGGGRFKVVRHLPETASILQYRVKSQVDGHERVVREDQLARS